MTARKRSARRQSPKRSKRGRSRPMLPIAARSEVANGGLGFGVDTQARTIQNLVLHVQTGYCVDPKAGQVYGRGGEPIGTVAPNDYVRISGLAGRPSTLYAHRLVWECVNGPIPDGHHIDHKNAIKRDNRSCNLQAVTPSRNCALVFERGGRLPGEGMGHSKLDEASVRHIRSKSQLSDRAFGRLYGVNHRTIAAVRLGISWKHVRPRRRAPTRGKRKD